MCCRYDWKWPSTWMSKYPVLTQIQVPNLHEMVNDEVMWKTNEGKFVNYATSYVWKDLDNLGQVVPWKPLIWFSQCSPKHSFVLRKQNLKLSCALCEKCPDSHDHLFFQCEFSKEVWYALLQILQCNLPDQLSRMVSLGSKNNIGSIVGRLLVGAAVYLTWKERNLRMFQGKKRTGEVMIQLVVENLRAFMMTLTVKDSLAVTIMGGRWNVKMTRNKTKK